MNIDEIKQAVLEFKQRTNFGGDRPYQDCFMPWYLISEYNLPETTACAQSSPGHGDFGLDGFHLSAGPTSELFLFQSKMSTFIAQAIEGVKDFEKFLPELEKILRDQPTDISFENHVLTRLRATIQGLAEKDRRALKLNFRVLHLCEHDSISAKIQDAGKRMRELLDHHVPEWGATLSDVNPLRSRLAPVLNSPKEAFSIAARGAMLEDATAPRVFVGMARLSDLVQLYERNRDQIFAANVRLLLTDKAARTGPYEHIREALKCIAAPGKEDAQLSPTHFMLHHNGVTLSSSRLKFEDGNLQLLNPQVLNGCQTIRTAAFFKNDRAFSARLDLTRWEQVFVPIRAVEVDDESEIHRISINNNRQNAVKPWALRSHEKEQVRLQERFRTYGVFYERRDGAYASLRFEDSEEAASQEKVHIKTLARALAATISPDTFWLVKEPNKIFESDHHYRRIFGDRNTRSMRLLVFVLNLAEAMPLALKDVKDKFEKFGYLHRSSLTWPMLHLMLRYIDKHYPTLAQELCQDKLRGSRVRKEISPLLASRTSDLRRVLQEIYLQDDPDGRDNAYDKELLSRASNKLYLANVNPFESWPETDELAMSIVN